MTNKQSYEQIYEGYLSQIEKLLTNHYVTKTKELVEYKTKETYGDQIWFFDPKNFSIECHMEKYMSKIHAVCIIIPAYRHQDEEPLAEYDTIESGYVNEFLQNLDVLGFDFKREFKDEVRIINYTIEKGRTTPTNFTLVDDVLPGDSNKISNLRNFEYHFDLSKHKN